MAKTSKKKSNKKEVVVKLDFFVTNQTSFIQQFNVRDISYSLFGGKSIRFSDITREELEKALEGFSGLQISPVL